MSTSKFRIGDIVAIINNGQIYATYSEMAKLLNATNWKSGSMFQSGEEGIIK